MVRARPCSRRQPGAFQVSMLYVGRLQTAHGTRVRHRRERLEGREGLSAPARRRRRSGGRWGLRSVHEALGIYIHTRTHTHDRRAPPLG